MNNTRNGERILCLDYLKALAIILVSLGHVTGSIISGEMGGVLK